MHTTEQIKCTGRETHRERKEKDRVGNNPFINGLSYQMKAQHTAEQSSLTILDNKVLYLKSSNSTDLRKHFNQLQKMIISHGLETLDNVKGSQFLIMSNLR